MRNRLYGLGTPGFDLGQGREGAGVIGLFQLTEHQAGDGAGADGKDLGCGGFFQIQHLGAAIAEPYCRLDPPTVVGEIRAQCQPQFVQGDGATEVQRQGRFGVLVDAPTLVGPHPMGIIFINTVHHIPCRKHRLAPGFHIGADVGIKPGMPCAS